MCLVTFNETYNQAKAFVQPMTLLITLHWSFFPGLPASLLSLPSTLPLFFLSSLFSIAF